MLNQDFKEFVGLLNANQVRYLVGDIGLQFPPGPGEEMPTIYLPLILRSS